MCKSFNYFSLASKRHHGRGNLQEKTFIGTHSARVLKYMAHYGGECDSKQAGVVLAQELRVCD